MLSGISFMPFGMIKVIPSGHSFMPFGMIKVTINKKEREAVYA